MVLIEKRMNLFEVEKWYYLAHCISSDYALGAGIAVEFQKRFHLKNKLKEIGNSTYPDCILIDKVFNLVTKNKYWHKPTYDTLYQSLKRMRDLIRTNDIEYLAMPKIGSGLDKLQWGKVKEMIELVFKDVDIQILVCYK